MIAATDISIEDDTAWYVPTQDSVAVLLRRCSTCDHARHKQPECGACDGSGRHTFDINVQGYVTPLRRARYSYEMRVSVVEVLPIVEWDGQPEGIACLDTLGNVWYPDIDREGEPVHYLKDHAVLPESAAPGKYAVQLRLHNMKTPTESMVQLDYE